MRVINRIKNIEVFGDSILKGIQINPKNSRYFVDNNIGIEKIEQEHEVIIENYSKFGCTIQKGYQNIMKRLNKGKFCDMIVMDFGGNDCDYDWKEISEHPSEEIQPKTPLDTFIETYKKIIEGLKSKGIIPVLTNLPPLAPQKFFEWVSRGLSKENILKWLGDINAIYRHQENYSRVIEKIAEEEDVPIVDLRGAFLQNRHLDDLLCEDGMHPNTKGQKVITKAFLEFAAKFAARPLPSSI